MGGRRVMKWMESRGKGEMRRRCTAAKALLGGIVAWPGSLGNMKIAKGRRKKGNQRRGKRAPRPKGVAHEEMEGRYAVAQMRHTDMRTRMGPRARVVIALGRERGG